MTGLWAYVIPAIGALLCALVAAIGSAYVTRVGHRSTRENNNQNHALGLAERLNERLEDVENRLERVEQELQLVQRINRALATFVDRIGLWLLSGRRGPMPRPPALIHDQIEVALWTDAPPNGGQKT